MNFVDSLKKWFFSNNSAAAGSGARIPLLDANGVAVGSDTYNAISEIVRQELGKILNGGTAQTTGITKVPSLVGNALGATTVANLASVLGGQTIRGSQYPTFASAPYGVYGIYGFNEFSDSPIAGGTSGLMIKTDCGSGEYSIALIETQGDNRVFVKYSYTDAWFEVTVPSFYKNYNSLDSLSVALGERKFQMGSGVPTIITNIPVNSLDGYPHAYTYIVSLHVDAGDGTIYEFGIIRVGYNGDHVTKIKLSGEDIITLGHSEGYVTITKTISTPLFGVITG